MHNNCSCLRFAGEPAVRPIFRPRVMLQVCFRFTMANLLDTDQIQAARLALPEEESLAITREMHPAEVAAMGPGNYGCSAVADFLLTAVLCGECGVPLPISAPETAPPPVPHHFELPTAKLRVALLSCRDLAEAISTSSQAKVCIPFLLTESPARTTACKLRNGCIM